MKLFHNIILLLSSLSSVQGLVLNGTIVNGVLTSLSSPNSLTNIFTMPTLPYTPTASATCPTGSICSSGIQSIITAYFSKLSTEAQKATFPSAVYIDNTILSYLTISGTYVADVPIVLPAQFVLVLNTATISAISTFTSPTNQLSPLTSQLSLIYANSNYQAVVGIGGPAKNVLSCQNMPPGAASGQINPITGAAAIGPPGITLNGVFFYYIEGITINSCGYGNGNIYSYASNGEISNVISINGQTRGIWLIQNSWSIIHDSEVYGSGKFGIDFDAISGSRIAVYRNQIHNNIAQEGILIEQGSQYSVVAYNNFYNNYIGVAFYNNNYTQPSALHYILSNAFYNNNAQGVKVGSLVDSAGLFFPGANSYIIGNSFTKNGLNLTAQQGSFQGFASNGPITGYLYANNADTDGFQQSSQLAATSGINGQTGIVINDYYMRVKVAGVSTPVIFTPNTGAVNATFNANTGIFTLNGVQKQSGMAASCSSINSILTSSFIRSTYPAYPFKSIPVWIFGSPYTQQISFLTISGSINCDKTVSIPPLTAIVLNGATINAAAGLSSVFDARNSSFSAIVNPGIVGSSIIDCKKTNAIGVSIVDSSYFTVDGVTINNCGASSSGAISVSNTPSTTPLQGNNTLISNLVINTALGSGIYISYGKSVSVHKVTVSNSASSGVSSSSYSVGTLILDSKFTFNALDGINIDVGSTMNVICGNTLTSNLRNGLGLYNADQSIASKQNMVINNTITLNKQASIVMSASNLVGGCYGNVLAGNTMSGNGLGVSVGGISGGVSHVGYFNNRDSDGLTSSTSFKSAIGFNNVIMDPFLRSSYPPPADTAASNNDENPTEVVSSYSSLSSQDLAVIGGAAVGIMVVATILVVSLYNRRMKKNPEALNELATYDNAVSRPVEKIMIGSDKTRLY